MLVYVLNKYRKPLMPCSPAKARYLLKQNKAKVIRAEPFTIKLLYGSSSYKQEIVGGMDTGSKTIGCAATANSKIIYQSEVILRQDISNKMRQRSLFRRSRRARKTRYRSARFNNRASSRAHGRIAPSIKSKFESHLREKNFLESILPIAKWKVELAQFDIHMITNPNIKGKEYQTGPQKGYYNVKAYVLDRDGYRCQSGQKVKHTNKLEVHHILFRSQGGTNTPSNLITLCERYHADLHAGLFLFKKIRSKTKHATEIGIVKGALLRSDWKFETTFGYETKFKREKCLRWDKTHANDAVAICCEDGEIVRSLDKVLYKKHVSKGDYKQTSGAHSQKRIPTGKLFGLRKFDWIKTSKGIGLIKGKRSTGGFELMNFDGTMISSFINVKKNVVRIKARTSTLISYKIT